MEEFSILILVSFIVTNLLDKAKSVQLEELHLQTFDELFVEEWLDKDEAEDLKTPPTNFGQIEPNLADQNPSLTESDHSDNAKNGEEQNKIIKEMTSNGKCKIVDKFHAIKDEFKNKGKYSAKELNRIEEKIGKHLKVCRSKIYKWKKEFGLSQKFHEKEERKHLVKKFDQRKAELKRNGFKNSQNEINETVAKELGLSVSTIYRWKRELGQTAPTQRYPKSKQKELMKRYYQIKHQKPKISDKDIGKRLNISKVTLYKWKKHFKRQQFHPNSVNVGHSVEVNAGSNAQEIGNMNPGNI